jgi:hypothetical protein
MYIFFKNAEGKKSPQKEGLGPRILSREGQSAFGSVRRKILKIQDMNL